MNSTPAPEPQHEHSSPSLLAFLLSHPPTPLSELPPEPPAPELPFAPGRRLLPETIAVYAQAFRELASAEAPITATLLAQHLGFRPSNIGRTVRILERDGYIRSRGTAPSRGPRPAIIWEWIGPEPKHGVRPAPRPTRD